MNNNKIRVDIEALRGFSVLIVILYHFNLEILSNNFIKNGFIGVDIFFVISGYIITKIILDNKNNSFSLINFYSRRIKRIIPLLVIVVILSIFLIFFIYDFFLLKKNIKSAYSISVAVSNFYFWLTSTIYHFAESNNLIFLHFWSLSIEMQFYIFFPFIFIFFKNNLNKIKYLLLLIFIVSYFFVLKNFQTHNLFNFYNSFSRAYELIAGSLFFIYSKNLREFVKKEYHFYFYVFGFFLILIFMQLHKNHDFYPNPMSLIFIIGVGLMLIFNEIDRFILIKKFLGKIGKISYSLYLWHFPLLVVGANIFFSYSDTIKICLIIICFLLSILSYNIIEKKFRRKDISKSIYLFLFLLLFLILSDFIANKKKENFSNYIQDNYYLADQSTKLLKNKKKYSLRKQKNIFSFESDSLNYSPQFSSNDNKIKILIIGDSHSNDLFNVFETNKNLFPNLEFARYGFNLKDLNNYRKNILLESSNFKKSDFLLVSSRYKKQDILYIDQLIEIANNTNKKIIITLKRPEFVSNNHKNQTVLDLYYSKNNIIDKNKFDQILYDNLEIKNFIEVNELIKEKFKNQVPLLNFFDIICNHENKKCHSLTSKNEKIFYDYGHFTLSGSKYLGKILHEKKLHQKLFFN